MQLNLPIYAFGGFSQSIGQQLPGLLEALKASPLKPPRRSDRLTQLSLLGLSATPGHSHLNPETQLVLASGDVNLDSTIQNNEQIFAQHSIPNPIAFINTVNNSTAFHICQALHIGGQVTTVSRGDCSLEAGLQVADTLREAHKLPILLGSVDEVPRDTAQHRRRLKLDPDEPLAEGSFWFHCGHPQHDESPRAWVRFCGPLENPQDLPAWCREQHTTHTLCANGLQLPLSLVDQLPGSRVAISSEGLMPTQNARHLQTWLATAHSGDRLVMLNQTPGSPRLCVTLIEIPGS
ncbi:MAG: hypothetical protein ABW076_18600 [Candidatus Thiodiazotropha sp.]